MKDSRFHNSFVSAKMGSMVNPDDFVCVDKETWNDIETKIKLMITDLEALNKENKKLKESLSKTDRNKEEIVEGYLKEIRVLKKKIDSFQRVNKQMLNLNRKLEDNVDKDRLAWQQFQRLSETRLIECKEAFEREKEELTVKFQSERMIVTDNRLNSFEKEKKINSGRVLLLEKQNEFLEAELAYYKKKAKDADEDRRMMENKAENYQGQLKGIMESINGLEEKFKGDESKIMSDSVFETLKTSINFNV